EGDVIALVEVAASEAAAPAEESAADDALAPEPAASQPAKQQPSPAGEPAAGEEHGYDCDVLVLGSGPGGYTAAFRAADLGLDVVLVERHSALGGVCLNVGCIPSKALLHSAKVIDDAAAMAAHGLKFGQPEIDLPALLKFKQSTIDTLTGGLAGMAKKRKVRVVTGTGRFKDAHTLAVADGDDISFNHAIIAVGSEPIMLPGWPEDERIWDSEAALSPDALPKSLLVAGGGIIGLELANVYASHGSAVHVAAR